MLMLIVIRSVCNTGTNTESLEIARRMIDYSRSAAPLSAAPVSIHLFIQMSRRSAGIRKNLRGSPAQHAVSSNFSIFDLFGSPAQIRIATDEITNQIEPEAIIG